PRCSERSRSRLTN
ncbi:hypothetical protein D041_0458B, partial [Vibrio parahaemolyticus EKP-008]